jgi:hypothetical protein
MILILVFYAIPASCLGIMRTSFGNVWPLLAVVRVDPQPVFNFYLLVCIRADSISWAFWFAYAAVYALIWMDDQHVLPFVETIY